METRTPVIQAARCRGWPGRAQRGQDACRRARRATLASAALVVAAIGGGGCKSALSEIRGKTAWGPEYRNRGDSTNEIRYDARQGLEFRWDNGMTTGVTYRRRDIDNGSGDNENLVLFEVGYPLWKAPKKEDATAKRLAALEEKIAELKGEGPTESKGTNP